MRGRRGTWRHVSSLYVALGDIDAHFAWQRLFAWQTWGLVTSTVSLRGRRGAWRHGPSLCVAGVALGDMYLHLTHILSSHNLQLAHTQLVHTQLAHTHNLSTHGHLRHWAGSGGAPGSQMSVAGVALGDVDAHFAWQAWHLRHWAGSGGAPGSQMTPWTPPLFAWQAWHLVTSTVALRGRRGTWRHGPSLCVAGVALGDIDAHFAWQVWHLRHWAGSGGAPGSQMTPWTPRLFAWQAWHLVTSTVTLRGRRGTWRHGLSLCVAGVALGDMAHFSKGDITLSQKKCFKI